MMAPWILTALTLALSIMVTRRRALTHRAGVVRALTGVVLVAGAAFTLIWMSVGNSDPAVIPLLAVIQAFAVALGVLTLSVSALTLRAPAPAQLATK